MDKVEVIGCFNCPLANKFSWCNHAKTLGRGIGGDYVPVDVPFPEWCPLKTEPITIILKTE